MRNFVSFLAIGTVPLGIFIGWMMALGNFGFVIGAVALIGIDYYSCQIWLKIIEEHDPPKAL